MENLACNTHHTQVDLDTLEQVGTMVLVLMPSLRECFAVLCR